MQTADAWPTCFPDFVTELGVFDSWRPPLTARATTASHLGAHAWRIAPGCGHPGGRQPRGN
ncbi:MAG: hypothetical protein KDA72_20865, partial [Planctomycetales bacterium]|nr:hypothetical protein [Planctomycetales bacterium]